MDEKYSVKLEEGLFEQTYKFRSGDGIEGLEDIYRIIRPEFIQKVEKQLREMQELHAEEVARFRDEQFSEFDTII